MKKIIFLLMVFLIVISGCNYGSYDSGDSVEGPLGVDIEREIPDVNVKTAKFENRSSEDLGE
ncbi:MAG: membrane lipoprotein lipid attachment site-containing protein [Candidatus Woesearchaeota archaeon]|nr:MAG: membrane lipoprotein lipid attachment site-containing protein [Candidatus Woesearchaeota archaeon]